MENDFEEILEPGPDCCIYRVPRFLRNINEEAYTPQLVSIGPLHYGRKELRNMESMKRKYWSTFGQRVNSDVLNEFKNYVEEHEQRIRNHYSVSSRLQTAEYTRMILHDSVFVVELILRSHHQPHDFLLAPPLGVSIKRDLLLIENQLPFFVLKHLYGKAFPFLNLERRVSLLFLFHSYFSGGNAVFYLEDHFSQVKHFSDFHRVMLLKSKPPHVESEVGLYELPCAKKLDHSGLKFKGLKNKAWLGIRVETRKQYGKEVNELQIPTIVINDDTESSLRNLIAFEMFHYPSETHVCHYAFLMDQLINAEADVDLLVEKGVIVNHVGDRKAIAKLFNRLLSNVTLSKGSCYIGIAEKLKQHYRYPWNHLKATLKSVYFGNLWTGTVTVVAFLLLILTVTQAVCHILQVVRHKI